MVKIRLKRIGMRKQPSYRIVAIDSQRSRDGKYLESLGHYNPRRRELTVDLERVEYWLSHGAQATSVTQRLIRRFKKEHTAAEEGAEVVSDQSQEAVAAASSIEQEQAPSSGQA